MRRAIKLVRTVLNGGEMPGTDMWRKEVSAADAHIVDQVRPYTATSVERILSLIEAVRYVSRSGIPGGIAECGVWKGGSMMAVALTLMAEGRTDLDLFLYDTFEGMSAPSAADRAIDGTTAQTLLANAPKGTGVWCYSTLDEVKVNLGRTAYPSERLHFIKGKVEDSIPQHLPGPLALLRLDTDWYESTKHELEHLFPLLQERGVMIIDDYGHWQGARKATDEFLGAQARPYFLHRIDYTGRLLIKA